MISRNDNSKRLCDMCGVELQPSMLDENNEAQIKHVGRGRTEDYCSRECLDLVLHGDNPLKLYGNN